MDKKLGEILVGYNQISWEILAQALQRQVVAQCRIGTALVQMERVRLDDVAVALSIQHGVPALDPRVVETIEPQVLACLTPLQCQHFGVIPIRREGNTLHLAMRDPARNVAGEISYAVGLSVQRYVVPELRVAYLLEKLYGIKRDPRFLRLPAQGQATHERRTVLEPTVKVEQPAANPWEANPADELGLVYLDEYIHTGATAEHKAISRNEGSVSTAGNNPEPRRSLDPGSATFGPTQQKKRPLSELELPIVIEEDPVEAPRLLDVTANGLDEAQTAEEVTAHLVQPVLERTAFSILFWVREKMALGCRAHGLELPADRIQKVVISLESPSLLSWVLQRRCVLRGLGAKDPLYRQLLEALGRRETGEVCGAPIFLNKQVVQILCVQSRSGSSFDDAAMQDLKRLVDHASRAYWRLSQRAQPA